jgi:hypothetical protein
MFPLLLMEWMIGEDGRWSAIPRVREMRGGSTATASWLAAIRLVAMIASCEQVTGFQRGENSIRCRTHSAAATVSHFSRSYIWMRTTLRIMYEVLHLPLGFCLTLGFCLRWKRWHER